MHMLNYVVFELKTLMQYALAFSTILLWFLYVKFFLT